MGTAEASLSTKPTSVATTSATTGLEPPTSSFNALRLNEPPTGYAPVNEPATLASPSAMYSRDGSNPGVRCLVDSALAMAMDSRDATAVITAAPTSSSLLSSEKRGTRPRGGVPNAPVMAMPRQRGQGLSREPHGVTGSGRKEAGAAALGIGTQPGASRGGRYVTKWPAESVAVIGCVRFQEVGRSSAEGTNTLAAFFTPS